MVCVFCIVTYAAASVLLLLCLCCVKDLGAYGLFVSRAGTNTGPFTKYKPHHPAPGGKAVQDVRGKVPSTETPLNFMDKKLLPRSWKCYRMQLEKIKTLNKCKLQWRSKCSPEEADGVCPA